MKRFLAILIFPTIIALSAVSSQQAHASSFDPGRIIDDVVMTNSSAMSAAQIQAFLNSKVTTCDTNGTMPASDFGRADLTHAQYAASRGWPAPPYTCLKDYTENGLTAAQLIYNLSQQYQINPQVFIVTLQKESSLVTDYWPLPSQYRTATGYGCPDSGPNNSANCNSSYYGFTNQITWTAKLYRSVLNQSSTWYSPYIVGNNYIQWSPNAACGGTTVNIQNWATAALYDYTPYQPNQSALNAGYGTGDSCGAYGNRNFFLYFNDWFGVTSYNSRLIRGSSVGSGVYLVENGIKRPFDSVEALYSHGYSWANVLTASDAVMAIIPTGPTLGINIPAYTGKLIKSITPGSGVYLVDSSTRRPFDSAEALYSYGYSWNNIITVSDIVLADIPVGAPLDIK